MNARDITATISELDDIAETLLAQNLLYERSIVLNAANTLSDMAAEIVDMHDVTLQQLKTIRQTEKQLTKLERLKSERKTS